jgi:hypothetical protein
MILKQKQETPHKTHTKRFGMPGDRSVSLWEDPFLCDSEKIQLGLTDRDKAVLCRLHQGERGKGIGLERIQGAHPNVLAVRIDIKRRLFLWMRDTSIVVIHIMTNHKYNRVPSHVYEFMFGQAFDPDKDNNLTYVDTDDTPHDFTSDKNFQFKEIKKAVCYNQNLIIYDENQENALSERLPVLLHGDFGSGKSALMITTLINAILSLKDVYPDKYFVYYSHMPALVRHMFDMFLLDNPNISNFIDINRIKFLDTVGFVREYGPATLKDKEAVGVEAFNHFISAHIKKNKPAALRGVDILSDVDALYDEFQIIATLADHKDYLNLGSHASNYSEPEIREWMLEVTEHYLKHMIDSDQFDPCVILWEGKEVPLALFVGDEMQSAPLSMIIMPTRLTHNRNIVLCGDPNQSDNRRLSVFPRTKEIFSQIGSPLNVCSIPGSYRSPVYLMPLINAVMAIKQYINHGLNDKHQSSEVSSKSILAEKGCINYVPLTELDKLKSIMSQGSIIVVITPEDFVEEAKKKFGGDVPVYTPRSSRGMEFLNVIHYKLMEKNFQISFKGKQAKGRKLAELINNEIIDMPDDFTSTKHQPKAGKSNPIYEAELNSWIIAFSRVKNGGHCYVVEDDQNSRTAQLRHRVKAAIIRGQALTSDNNASLAEATKAEWEAFAIKNIELGNREQALIAYKRLGKTEAELNEAIAVNDQVKKSRINIVLNRVSSVTSENKLVIKKEEVKTQHLTKKPKTKKRKAKSSSIATVDYGMSNVLNMLINSDDKIKALIGVINRYKDSDWLASVSNGNPFFLEMIHNDSLAKAFYSLILKSKGYGLDGFFSRFFPYVAEKINWLHPKNDQGDSFFSWLHSVMEDNMRFMIFKNVVELSCCNPLGGFSNKDQLSILLVYYESAGIKTLLPLGAVIAIKSMRLFELICKKNLESVEFMVRALLSDFLIDEKKTNVVCRLMDKLNKDDLRQFDSILSRNENKILSKIVDFYSKINHKSDIIDEAFSWCANSFFRMRYEVFFNEPGKGRYDLNALAGILNNPNIFKLLWVKMYDKKTFFERLMVSKITRNFVFNWLVGLKVFSLGVEKIDFNPNQLVETDLDYKPLIFDVYLRTDREILLSRLVGEDCNEFYGRKVDGAHWVTPYRIPGFSEKLPLIYFMANQYAHLLSPILYNNFFNSVESNYWLSDWNVGNDDPQSILFLFLKQVSFHGEKLTNEQLIYLDYALALLLNFNKGDLLKSYIGYYCNPNSVLPISIHKPASPHLLFDVCFYLSSRLNRNVASVVKAYSKLILDSIPIRDLFSEIEIQSAEMPLFYYLVNNEFLFYPLKDRFENALVSEGVDCFFGLYEALTKKQINNSDDDQNFSFNALVKLITTKAGIVFLRHLIWMSPGLASKLKVEDFNRPGKDGFYSNSALIKLMSYTEEYNLFYEDIASRNPSLSRYLVDFATWFAKDKVEGVVEFAQDNVGCKGDQGRLSDSSKDNKVIFPEMGSLSALKELGLFNAVSDSRSRATKSKARRRLVFDS